MFSPLQLLPDSPYFLTHPTSCSLLFLFSLETENKTKKNNTKNQYYKIPKVKSHKKIHGLCFVVVVVVGQ